MRAPSMRSFIAATGVSLAACCLVITSGCGDPTPQPAVTHEHDGHDDDHDGHDHDGHDHSTTIDADAMGLNADDLVSLDQPDLPDNFADAVKQLVQLRDVIRDAFKADDAEAAHNPLHEVGNLLGGIESLISSGKHDAEHKKELATAVDELFDSYTAVDETFHSDGGKKYSEVESKIDAAVKTLQEHVDH